MRWLPLLLLAGCNQILGNGNFTGPNSNVDACTGAVCPVDAMPDGPPDASMTCQNMGKPATTISGWINAPNGTLSLPNVVVYVPMHPPDALTPGVSCGCTPATGGAITSATTDADGHFTLTDPPTGANVPIVIQLGKWRRQITMQVDACTDNPMSASNGRLPRTQAEGDMPRIAISTGAADELECLVRQVGIDDSEIGNAGDARAVHLFTGMQPGANAFASGFPGGAGNFQSIMSVTNDLAKLNNYDRVMFSCEGNAPVPSSAQVANVVSWANAGGQLLIEHYERAWMTMGEWSGLAQFTDGALPSSPANVTIDQSFPKGVLLTSWLAALGVSTTGMIQVVNARNSVMGADQTRVQVWAHLDPSQTMGLSGFQIFAFRTPIGVAPNQQCGRVIFSDMHQSGNSGTNMQFPNECTMPGLTAQQDVLAFLFFDEQTCLQ